MRTTPNGVSVCSFTIAVNSRKPNEQAQYFRINAWRALGETCQKNLLKGRKVGVVGELFVREYDSHGEKKVSLDVNADDVEFLSPKEPTKAPSLNDYINVPFDDNPF